MGNAFQKHCVNQCWIRNVSWNTNCRLVENNLLINNLINTKIVDKCDPKNQEVSICNANCNLTCQNGGQNYNCYSLPCESGCVCKEGLIWDENKLACIDPDECEGQNNIII